MGPHGGRDRPSFIVVVIALVNYCTASSTVLVVACAKERRPSKEERLLHPALHGTTDRACARSMSKSNCPENSMKKNKTRRTTATRAATTSALIALPDAFRCRLRNHASIGAALQKRDLVFQAAL